MDPEVYNHEIRKYPELIERIRKILELPGKIKIGLSFSIPPQKSLTEIKIGSGEKPVILIINKHPEMITDDDIILLKNELTGAIKKTGTIPGHLSKFIGWWIIFTGSITLFAVCPICGSAGCAGSLAFTGIFAAVLSFLKNGSSLIKKIFKPLFIKKYNPLHIRS